MDYCKLCSAFKPITSHRHQKKLYFESSSSWLRFTPVCCYHFGRYIFGGISTFSERLLSSKISRNAFIFGIDHFDVLNYDKNSCIILFEIPFLSCNSNCIQNETPYINSFRVFEECPMRELSKFWYLICHSRSNTSHHSSIYSKKIYVIVSAAHFFFLSSLPYLQPF